MDAPRLYGHPGGAGDSLTVGEVIDRYLRHAEAEAVHCPEARADRQHVFALFVARHGQLAVNDLRPYHLTDFVADQPGWRSVGTRRAKAGYVKAAFAWAWREGRIDRHPFPSVQYGEAERRPDMPDAVFEQLCRLANKPYERALRFLRLTACRLSELCRATWGEFDLEKGIWVIEKHKSRESTKRAKVIALVPEAVDLLRGMAATAADHAATPEVLPCVAIGTAGQGQRVFLNTQGRPWTRWSLGRQLAFMKQRHGIAEKASLHGIRHRFGTAAVANGAPVKLVGAQMGHATVRTTEKYYVDLRHEIEAIREAAKKGLPKTG